MIGSSKPPSSGSISAHVCPRPRRLMHRPDGREESANRHDEAAASPPETGDRAGTLFSPADRVSAVEFPWALG